MSAAAELGKLSRDEAAQVPAPREPDTYIDMKLVVFGVEREITAEVFARWHEGEPRTYSHPGAAAGWEIEEVKWEGMFLTPLLSEDQLDAIARDLA